MRDLIYRLLFGYDHIIIAEYRENEVESEIAHTSSFLYKHRGLETLRPSPRCFLSLFYNLLFWVIQNTKTSQQSLSTEDGRKVHGICYGHHGVKHGDRKGTCVNVAGLFVEAPGDNRTNGD